MLAVVAGGCRSAPQTGTGMPAAAHALPAPADTAEPAGEECTVGVAAGSATADGRPLLWKNRDAQQPHNVVTWFDDAGHPYVGLCDAGSTTSVSGGCNAAGFCIMNAVSRDLPQGNDQGPGNGPFMKLALRRCVTVDDFEALLRESADGGRRTRANFGVIDARGGAAMFETSHRTHRRFDAAAAAGGLVVRTNFATTAAGDRGKERFARVSTLCRELPPRSLDVATVLDRICRDLAPPGSAQRGAADQLDVRETIHRQTTVAALVFHGIHGQEPPALTTMWAIVGQPLFGIAVPCWPAAGAVAQALSGQGEGKPGRSPLCDLALQLADRFYATPPPRDAGSDDDGSPGRGEAEVAGALRWLATGNLPALQQRRSAAEAAIRRDTTTALAGWRRQPASATAAALRQCHEAQAAQAEAALRELVETFAAEPAGAGR
jgi:hypothetical protein